MSWQREAGAATAAQQLAAQGLGQVCPSPSCLPSPCLLASPRAAGPHTRRYAGFELGQRGQLQEIFDELKDPKAKRSAGGRQRRGASTF